MPDITLNVKRLPPVNIGDKVYVVYAKSSRAFRTVCPVCGGRQKIRVPRIDGKGTEEILCSFCDYRRKIEDQKNVLLLWDFRMDEYTVFSIYVEGPAQKNMYTKDGCSEPLVVRSVQGFAKSFGTDYKTLELPLTVSSYDRSGKKEPGERMYFTSKAKALSYLAKLVDDEKKKLEDFNREYGTAHQWPFPEEDVFYRGRRGKVELVPAEEKCG